MSRLRSLELACIVLLYCNLFNSAQYTLFNPFTSPPTFSKTRTDPLIHRDDTSFFITQRLGPPSQYTHFIIPLSTHSAFNILYSTKLLPLPIYGANYTRRPILNSLCRILILFLLSSSGDIESNPGPSVNTAVPILNGFSYADFCNRKNFGFMHINIRSLLPKLDLFTALAHASNPDILAVSESWLRKSTIDSDVSIPNYNIYRQDRSSKGGGVMLYCRECLQCTVILSKCDP